MKKTITQKDLLRYAYNETNMHDADSTQRSIDGDPIVQQDFNEIVDVMNKLDEGKEQPSQKSIDKILAAAKKIKA